MSGPQLTNPVASDHAGLHLERDAPGRHFLVSRSNVVDFEHQLCHRIVGHRFINLVQNQLHSATVQEHERPRVHDHRETNLLGPERNRAFTVADPQDYAGDLHARRLRRELQCRDLGNPREVCIVS